jgi:hypothetical protein
MVSLPLRHFLRMSFRSMFADARERFSRQEFDARLLDGPRRQRHRDAQWLVPLAVIIVFEIFEYVADVQEGVPVQSDVNEGGLHAWQDAGNFAFVDAADQRELFFALDVNLD